MLAAELLALIKGVGRHKGNTHAALHGAVAAKAVLITTSVGHAKVLRQDNPGLDVCSITNVSCLFGWQKPVLVDSAAVEMALEEMVLAYSSLWEENKRLREGVARYLEEESADAPITVQQPLP